MILNYIMLNQLGSSIKDRKPISFLVSVFFFRLFPLQKNLYTTIKKSRLFYKIIIVMPSNGISTCMIVTLPVRKFKIKINKNVQLSSNKVIRTLVRHSVSFVVLCRFYNRLNICLRTLSGKRFVPDGSICKYKQLYI